MQRRITCRKKLYDNDRLDVLSSLEPRGDLGPGSKNGPGLGERRRRCLKERKNTLDATVNDMQKKCDRDAWI